MYDYFKQRGVRPLQHILFDISIVYTNVQYLHVLITLNLLSISMDYRNVQVIWRKEPVEMLHTELQINCAIKKKLKGRPPPTCPRERIVTLFNESAQKTSHLHKRIYSRIPKNTDYIKKWVGKDRRGAAGWLSGLIPRISLLKPRIFFKLLHCHLVVRTCNSMDNTLLQNHGPIVSYAQWEYHF